MPSRSSRIRQSTRRVATHGGLAGAQARAIHAIHAMILLAQGESVTDTATLCGWSTTSAFIDSFRLAIGQTPGAYRDLAARQTQQQNTGS
jgi:AraC-like DNA-binding protein